MNNKQVAHIWAQQNTASAKGSNFYFEGPTIYSYGSHFPIATFIKPGVVLFTTKGYSSTTSTHKTYVSLAITPQTRVYTVPYLMATPDNIKYYIEEFNRLIGEAKTSTKTGQLVHLAENVRYCALDYAQEFGFSNKSIRKLSVPPELTERIKEQAEKAATKEQRDKERRGVELKCIREKVLQWIGGENINGINKLPEIYLRSVSGGGETIVQTSHGAQVEYKEAKVLYSLIKAGKDIKGHTIGHFTVIGINGTLKIGCHEITREEIERFAKSQGW